MPRKRRIAIIGEIHHVMSRGLEGKEIFRDDDDREKFLSITGKSLLDGDCRCYGWVLMNNHYHLVIRPLGHSLQRVMRRVNGAYALYFNKKYNRRGYLFQDRYKSLATQEHWYLKELIRYVHLNPVRAGVVKNLEDLQWYPWSGHVQMIGADKKEWFNHTEALSKFGLRKDSAQKNYLDWLSQGVGLEGEGWRVVRDTTDEEGVEDLRISGEAIFVKKVLMTVQAYQSIAALKLKHRKSMDTIFDSICKKYKLSQEYVLTKGRQDKRSEAKKKFCKEAIMQNGYSLQDVASFLNMNSSSVYRMVW